MPRMLDVLMGNLHECGGWRLEGRRAYLLGARLLRREAGVIGDTWGRADRPPDVFRSGHPHPANLLRASYFRLKPKPRREGVHISHHPTSLSQLVAGRRNDDRTP